MGVALISDVFMGAIEKITSRKYRKVNSKTGRSVTTLVWNATVANLSLMALGSSAPEILLSVIELVSNEFFSGSLGPSTIVGSAAFNLFCITGVCVSCIPNDETRRIKEVPVYVVTASFSIFAYLWLLFILKVSSENVIEVWEGAITFLFFPLLVCLAFIADKGCKCAGNDDDEEMQVCSADMSKEELAALEANIRAKHGQNLTDEQVMKLIEHCQPPTSRANYRIGAIRGMTGSRRVENGVQSRDPLFNVVPMVHTAEACDDRPSSKKDAIFAEPIVFFPVTRYAILENVGKVLLPVHRSGDTESKVAVRYTTRDGTAKAGEDYKKKCGELEFFPGDAQKSIEVEIIDDQGFEQDEIFYVDLTIADNGCIDDERKTAQVTIIDDDEPGKIRFGVEVLEVVEQRDQETIEITVERFDGCVGTVGCRYSTEDDTALAGCDYETAEGYLEFREGQQSATFSVPIKYRGRYDRRDMFRIYLRDPDGGAKFDPKSDGGSDSCIMSVVLLSDTEAKRRIDRMMSSFRVDWAKAKVGHANWKEQLCEAIQVNGGDEEDEVTMVDWLLHILTFPWKLLCACVPPTDFAGGWLCFCCALGVIGLVTAVIGDLASLLGCCMDIPDQITAITLVALGTSLPDTFASKTAAQQDPYADASIGNVTGSNSVNVFLGLGLPWTMGSIYWTCGGPSTKWNSLYADKGYASDYLGGALIVEAGDLGFSVAVFSSFAACTICVLAIRRGLYGGELGGPKTPKHITSALLVGTWFVYVGLSSWGVLSAGESST